MSDGCRTQSRMARRVNMLLYVVKSTGFVAFSHKLKSRLLPNGSVPSSLCQSACPLDRSVSRWKRSCFGASKLQIHDSHRIYFSFSLIFTFPRSSVVFHVRITFLYSRPDACRVSGECRTQGRMSAA